MRRRFRPVLISSLPATAELPPFISFSTSYAELGFGALLSSDGSGGATSTRRSGSRSGADGV